MIQNKTAALLVAAIIPILILTAWGVAPASKPAPANRSAESSRELRPVLYFQLSTPTGVRHEYEMQGVGFEFPNW